MYIILIFIALTMLLWLGGYQLDSELLKFTAFCAAVILAIMLVCAFLTLVQTEGWRAEFGEAKASLERARENAESNPVELAAIQQTVVEYNTTLASNNVYRNNHWYSWFAMDLSGLEPIQ